jgi:hypothetical protein
MVDQPEVAMTDIAIKPDADATELDADLLAEAQRQLSASPNATINEALQRLVDQERDRRGSAYDNLQQMAGEGGLDLDAVREIER